MQTDANAATSGELDTKALRAAIVAQLRTGPKSWPELMAATGQAKLPVKQQLRSLEQQGKVDQRQHTDEQGTRALYFLRHQRPAKQPTRNNDQRPKRRNFGHPHHRRGRAGA